MLVKINEILRRKTERKENETEFIKYYNMEEVTVKGFCNFCRNNIPLIIAVSITLVFTYGIKLFSYSIGMDTEQFMVEKSYFHEQWISISRFGQTLLSKLWYIDEFNPFTAFFTAFCLIWFFTISWCFIIAVFSRDTSRNNKLIPFALVLMTMPVWADQFHALLQSAQNTLIISICPYVIYLLFKGFLDNEKKKIICGSILLAFMPSVYQPILPMFCCGVFICFMLLSEHSDYEPQIYRNLCLKLFITLLGSLMVYLFLARIIPVVLHIESYDYLGSYGKWGIKRIRENILAIIAFGYIITVGHIPLVQSIVNPIIARYASSGIKTVQYIASLSRPYGNILLLPSVVLFIINVRFVIRRTIPSGRRLLYMLAGIGIPLCIIFPAIVLGMLAPMRALYALPLAFAFMLFYLIRTYKKKAALIVTCLSLLTAVYQAEITAQLFYSEQLRYNEDVRLSYELDKLITQVQPADEKLPVVFTGKFLSSSRFQANPSFMQGEIIGHSIFGWEDGSVEWQTIHDLSFMKGLGINYDVPNKNQVERAKKDALSIPPYPDPGCVKRMRDYIVVRLSEDIENNPWWQ